MCCGCVAFCGCFAPCTLISLAAEGVLPDVPPFLVCVGMHYTIWAAANIPPFNSWAQERLTRYFKSGVVVQINESEDNVFNPQEEMISVLLTGKATASRKFPAKSFPLEKFPIKALSSDAVPNGSGKYTGAACTHAARVGTRFVRSSDALKLGPQSGQRIIFLGHRISRTAHA